MINSGRTYAKISGEYPSESPTRFHRHKDWLVLNIGAVGRLPAHDIAIEMGPVLPIFRDMVDEADRLETVFGKGRCAARLRRDRRTIGRCQLRRGHSEHHLDFGSAEALDNWPPRVHLRWADGVRSFVPYEPDKPGIWVWSDDESPVRVPARSGRLSPSASRLERARIGNTRIGWRVGLPPMKKFLSHNPSHDPLTLFMVWIAAQLGGVGPDQQIRPSAVLLRRSDADLLREVVRFWFERKGDKNQALWADLQWGPVVVDNRVKRMPRWATPGFAYVAEDFLINSETGNDGMHARFQVIDLEEPTS